MVSRWLLSLLICIVVFAIPVKAAETTLVRDVLGPEGPLYIDGKLYYVGWVSNALSMWDGKTSVVLNRAPNCGHNGLAVTARKTFMLACTNDPGAILELDMSGKELKRWDHDSDGRAFIGGVNDLVVTANGGVYATLFGPFTATPTVIVGRVLYLAPGAGKWITVASDLNYANGVGVSPDQKTLYVSETVSNLIVKFSIGSDGRLSNRSDFALLNLLVPDKVKSWWLGPDSMKIDHKGNLYVAQWSGGKVLKISPEGKLLHVFDIAAGNGTTNVAFGPGERQLYVTVAKDPLDAKAWGSIVVIDNVK